MHLSIREDGNGVGYWMVGDRSPQYISFAAGVVAGVLVTAAGDNAQQR